MTTTVKCQCPVCREPGGNIAFAVDHDRNLTRIEDARIEAQDCEHRIVAERIAEDDGALLDMLRDAFPNGVERAQLTV